ncbi:flagellar protein FlgN [Puniceibacterium sp. IMCC21224]|uniref:flagellar protein FlgN n=1 Tax=Puniceibacterium sp. IMCC21224 TaxID=1618204 RepID=UPI00065D8933|nr:flagellar protein FlgN [Puniceibacterium sp. IMCC21224]KMK65888.1 hypothetical protein IMCC21224_11731 [Puniceibacterium sp. IMCC21224]
MNNTTDTSNPSELSGSESAQDITTIMDALDTLLEEERVALLAGEFLQVDTLMRRKEALIDALKNADAPIKEDLQPLHIKLGRNQVLFDHALEGIRNVASRLGTLRQLRKSLDTYDEHGRKSSIAAPDLSRLEKRA